MRPIAKARKVFARIAVKKIGCSGVEVVQFLGVTTSAVNRLAVSKELDEVKVYT